MIFITRKIQQHREGEGTCIAREKVDSREAVFFIPGFQFRDGILSLHSHPGVRELTVYREFSDIYICFRAKPFYNDCSHPIQNYSKAIINYCLSIIIFKLHRHKIPIKEALLLQ